LKQREATIYDEDYQRLIAKLVAARKAKGLTQSALAEKVRVGQYDVSKIENCVRRLDVVELRDWLKALGIKHDPLTLAVKAAQA
jgi:transcriptional regulator with XRE-family HTH domain